MTTPSPPAFSRPYADEATNTIYELLFCDNIALFDPEATASSAYPWNILFSPAPEAADLQKIVFDETVESRVKLLACAALRKLNQPIEEKELLGVIVEVGLDEGLDVLASYQDGSARYINYTGKMILWDVPDKGSAEMTAQIFRDSLNIVHRIGPWTEPRRSHPSKGIVRISFLVSDGLYFGEGPVNVLFNDELAAPALSSCTGMMQYLTEKVEKTQI
ncbi:MAG: hypothetical protein SH808_02655 [Saprospiraceae bacterium]|nr:hypothetical protein [Saprospiraceae bacterium]